MRADWSSGHGEKKSSNTRKVATSDETDNQEVPRGVKGRKSHETEDQEIPSGVEWEEVFKRRAGGMLNRGRLGVKKEP